MFRDNKREIFGFRKYKAYGLASAVIAAFFLMGGVASADEVTSAPSDATAHVVTLPTETSADTATVASGVETSANNAAVENTVANTATTNTVTETPAATVDANTATETPAVASGDRASANTETASTTSPYVSGEAKQSVRDNLAPLAEVQTSAPIAAQVYREDASDKAKLTDDDKIVEAESKEAFDKLPDAVRRRVKSVNIVKREDGNLGHTASVSGNVTLNAQYFHNDGKDAETEVLYHEIGHAVDGATYKRNQDGSEYSLSRDTAVQPLIQKAYPGQVNYEGWASMFGTYMLQKTGQREIKTELDREINTYFTNLMVGFTEPKTKLRDELVNVNTGDLNVMVSTRSSDRTVVATNANNGVNRLNNLTPHGLDITVSGKGALTDNSYIDVTVETNLPVNDINKDEILTDTFKGTSYVPTQGDYKKSTQTARISLAGLTDGTQKEYVIQANEFHKDVPVMSNLKRIVTYKVYIDGALQATKVLTDTLIPTEPLLDGKTSETQYVRTRGESVDDRYLLTSDDSVIRVNSKRPYGVYEVTVPDDVKMTLGQDESLESCRAGNKYVLPQNVIDAKKIRFNTSVAARKALDANPDQKRLDQTVTVSYYYSDKKFEDLSSAKKIEMSRPLVTLLSDVIPGEGKIELSLSIEKPRVFVLSTSSDNIVKGTLKNGTTSSPKKAVAVNDTILTLNMDEKPLNESSKFILQPMRTDQGSTIAREFRNSTMKVSVVDADTGVKIGVAEAYKALDIPKTTKRLKLHVETNEKLGYLQDSTLSELHYSVTFKSNAKDAISWKKDMDNQNSNETETRFKFDLLNDQGGTIVNNETKLTIFNDKAVVNIGESTYAVFTPTSVQKDLLLPILTSKSLRGELFPLAGLEYVKVDDSNNILKSRVFYTGPIEDESRRPIAGSYVDTVYDGSPGVYSGIWFKSELPAGTNVYEIPVHLKMKDPIYALNDKGALVNGESHGYLRVLTYDAKSRVTLSTISYKSQQGKKVVVDDQTKEVTLSSYVYNMTDSRVDDLSAMAYIPKVGVEGSTAGAQLVRKVDAPSGWKVLYTTNDISGDYSRDRNLAFSESVDDYTKVTALKFVAEQPVAAQSGKRFDVPVLTKMTKSSDTMYYRTTLLTSDKEVLSAPVVATPDPKSLVTKLTIKHVLDPNDAMTNKFRNMQLTIGDLQHSDLQQTGELKRPVVKTINGGSTELISKLASKTVYESYDISKFTGSLEFDYTRVTAEMTDDLKEQLNAGNINVDHDTSIRGTGVGGSEATITYYYKVRTGKLVERFVNKDGVEIAPSKESAESIAYGELVPTGHPDTIKHGGVTYNYESMDAPSVYRSRLDGSQFGVVDGTTTVTYVYNAPKPVVTKLTIKHVLDPNDAMTNKFKNMQLTIGDLQHYDLQQTGKLKSPVVKTINSGSTESISKLASKSIYEPYDISTFGDGLQFDYTRVTAEMTDDLKDQLNSGNINVDTDTSIQGTGKSGSEATITYYYKVRTGKLVERFVNKEGVEIAPAKESAETIAHGDFVPTGHPDTIKHGGVTYNYESMDAPSVYRSRLDGSQFGVVDGTTTVTYVYAPDPKSIVTKLTIKHVLDPNDEMTNRFRNMQSELGDLQNYDLQRTGELKRPVVKTINGGSTELISKLASKTVYEPYDISRFGDGMEFDYTRVTAEMTDDLKDQLNSGNINVDADTSIRGTGVSGSEATITYYYKVRTGKLVERFVNKEGVEIAPTKESAEAIAYGEFVPTDHPNSIEYGGGTYNYDSTDAPSVYRSRLDSQPGHTRFGVVAGTTTVTYVYDSSHEVPGDAPRVEIPELKVTRYTLEDRVTEIKDANENFTEAPKMIGNYQFTGVTDVNESNDVQTHIYKRIETEIPGDAPQVDVPELKVTRYMLEDRVTEIKDANENFTEAPKTIGDYQFTGVTDVNESNDVQTHIYKRIETEIPGDAPQVDVPELKVTRYMLEDRVTEIKDANENFTEAPKTIGDYQFTGVTDVNEGNDVQTHIYTKIVTEIPGDAPIVDIPELRLTRHISDKGKELLPIEEGSNGPRKTIGDYEYTGRTDVEGAVTTHVYAPIRYEIPGDAPQYDIPELKATRHVDEKGKELIETEKGTQPPRKTIGENEYTGRTTEKNGITTHVYELIKHEIPGDAPIVDVPELKVTRYVNEKGEEIKESEAGFINAPKTIGEYEFTGKTELNDGKDVQTHIYKLVEKPVTPTPDPKKPETPSPRTPEPKKPETPQPEAPKPIETPKSNDSKPVVAESVDQPQFVKNELPKTGETNSNLALVGVSLLTALGLIGFVKRKREN